MKKIWEEIDDKNVRHVWKANCFCDNTSENAKVISLPPTFYQDNGTPICGECGEDMTYIRTEILDSK